MDLETRERTIAASRQHIGRDTFSVIAGQRFKIETSPDGEEILNVVCPEGKSWTVHIVVSINEVDS